MTARPKPAKRVQLDGPALTSRNRKIDSRARQRCERCGVFIRSNASRHHRKFRSRRGGDEVSNGMLLCGSGTTGCHGWAHAEPEKARRDGFAVESWENPADVPVKHALYGWVLLWDDGTYTPVGAPAGTAPARTLADALAQQSGEPW